MSLNVQDVRCGVSGLVRDAEGSPCCSDYWKCPIWRQEKERLWKTGHANKADKNISAEGIWE